MTQIAGKNGVETAAGDGKLAENILHFSRILRSAGIRVGPAEVMGAIRAVETAGITTREDFYWTLHCSLVSRREDHPVFDEAFRIFWRSRELVEKMLQMFSPTANPSAEPEPPKAGQSRVSKAMFPEHDTNKEIERPEVEVDARFTASAREVLRKKDFAQMSVEELEEARRLMANFALREHPVRTRRFEVSAHSAKADPRRMFAKAMRTGGDLVLPQFRRHRKVEPPIVILADISGSMSQYSRTFLHFFHALASDSRRVHTFLFGTRLSNVTRLLKSRDPDEALQACADAVEDWSGGTRIGEALAEFNKRWSRRVMAQGPIVLLITDGLERGEQALLETEIDRLHRSCRRLVWLNPLLRFDGFEPAARGIRTILKHVDEFRPVHSLDALGDLCRALEGKGGVDANLRAKFAA